MDTGESGQLWRQTRETFDELVAAQRRKDTEAAGILLNDLGRQIKAGHMDYAAWDDVMKLIDRRVRLVEAEGRRLEKMKQMITRDQGMLLVGALLESVRRNIDDPVLREAIRNDFDLIVGRPEDDDRPGIDSGSIRSSR